MARSHKAASEVTIAPTEEKSAFASVVDRFWRPFALVAALIAAGILVQVYLSKKESSAKDESWNRLSTLLSGSATPAAADLTALLPDIGGTIAEPWTLCQLTKAALREGDFDTAINALDQLESKYSDHFIVRQEFDISSNGETRTMLGMLRDRAEGMKQWDASHAWLLGNPDPATGAQQVRIKTDMGTIVLGMYSEQAPKHVENFIKLCGEGFYDGINFHRIISGFMIQTGDPNTKEGERSTWGQGGPGYTTEREENDLYHFKGYVAAAKKSNETASSGSQFYITTSDRHDLDGDYVVFGKVLEGFDVIEQIESSATNEQDQPEEPTKILSTEVQ